ncbi:MAG: hypothetical protein LT080_07895 [Thiobacillus sp.]|nr:hypothetical protein [Thiobacillus sp.]
MAIDDGVDHPDFLRTPSNVCRPDPRNESSKFAEEHGFGRSLDSHHGTVSALVLNDGVPDNIRIQFETTKNLYLYAWFVYRFYPVAELHAHTCLELALRTRFADESSRSGKPRPGLRQLLERAVKDGILKSENFVVWRRATAFRAKNRALHEQIGQMEQLGLDEAVFDESNIVIKDEDRDHDYLGIVVESMPKVRNHFAHGSSTLHNQAIGSLRLVQEIIDQLWPASQ